MAKRTRLEMSTVILRNLGNAPKFYTTTDRNDAMNKAQNDISEHTLAYVVTPDSQSTVAGQAEYDMPTDPINVISVTYDSRRLTKVNESQIIDMQEKGYSESSNTGEPQYWSVSAFNKVRLFPTPANIKTLKIRYATYAPSLDDDADTTIYPRAAEEYIINMATAYLFLRDNEINRWAVFNKEALKQMDKIQEMLEHGPIFADVLPGGIL